MKKNSTLLKLNKFTKNSFLSYATVIIFYAVISILMSNGGISSSFKGQLIPICAYAVMAVSLNLTVGILGDLSLGHAGFMSVGAFAGVIASQSMHFNGVESDALRMLVAIVVGIVVAAVFGIIIGVPVLRLKGDYLAIVTLAFGEIIRDILNCFYIGIDKKGCTSACRTQTTSASQPTARCSSTALSARQVLIRYPPSRQALSLLYSPSSSYTI